jgi:hypothetical protein
VQNWSVSPNHRLWGHYKVGGSFSIGGKIWFFLPRSIGSGQFIPAMCFIHLFISSRKPPPPFPHPHSVADSEGWGMGERRGIEGPGHKSTYINRDQSSVFRTIDPQPPPHPASVSSPCTKGVGVHTRRAVRGWGSIFRKTPDIGLASYSIIPLRVSTCHVMSCDRTYPNLLTDDR